MGTALTGQKPKDTYKDLLHLDNSNSGVDATVRTLVDGNGTDSGVAVSTGGVFGANANGGGVLDEAASATNPTIVPDRADPDTGLGAVPATADVLVLTAGAIEGFRVAESGSAITLTGAGALTVTGGVFGANANGGGALDEAASATNPTLVPDKADLDTGIGAVPGTGDILVFTAGGVEGMRITEDTTTQCLFPDGTAAKPVIAFADETNFGFYSSGTTKLNLSMGGNSYYEWGSGGFFADQAGAANMAYAAATATLPSWSFVGDTDTGIGRAGADQLSLVAGGVEGLRLVESTGVLQQVQINTGLTADSGSVQGGTPLTSSYNVIATCATAGDSVTLPSAVAGYRVTIINNGAESADVFPASGDDCGGGVNTAVALASGADVTYLAIDATNWEDIT